MSLNDLFSPIKVADELEINNFSADCWINSIDIYHKNFPNIKGKKLAIIGVISKDSNSEANIVRNHLYSMTKKEHAKKVVDLGNFIFDEKDKRIMEKLGYAISEVMSQGLIPVLIGKSQEVTFAQYLAFEYLERYVNIINVDSRIDLFTDDEGEVAESSYLAKILMKEPPYLFNLCQLGYQSYHTDSKSLKTLDDQHFELIRLGKLRDSFEDVEPIIRSAEMMSFDISSIRQSDSPAGSFLSPSGLTAEEACKICRIAGISDHMNSIGFYEYSSEKDSSSQTGHLIAQMIWYFTDGVLHRITEGQPADNPYFVKYMTSDNAGNYEMVFYKSKKSNRWWMEVPVSHKHKNYIGKELFPCSYKDYEKASKGEIPERWWKALKKLT